MILKFALKSLGIRPVKTVVLASGFGLGVAVMAVLLGVGEVILDQARAPALQGGGDVVVSGAFGPLESARFVLSNMLRGASAEDRIAAVSPWKKSTLYLITPDKTWTVGVRGGVPSLEKSMGDPEVIDQTGWVDEKSDTGWIAPDASDVLRAMDRFHPQPDAPEFASSWAEWLYFNGRTADGHVRFYLTFLVGPTSGPGKRSAGVRLQLDRDGRQTNYSSSSEVDEAAILAASPDLKIGDSHVLLDGLRYEIAVSLPAEGGRSHVIGDLTLTAAAGRSLPPAVMHGAHNWLSGYVVPVLSGSFDGTLTVDGDPVVLDGASGYHDHNWGFWRDVRWQWGQVAHADLSIVYGRVFPPASVADPNRVPGFLGVLGPNGPLAVSTDVSIEERGEGDSPNQITIRGRGADVDLSLDFTVEREIRTNLQMTSGAAGRAMDFLQLGGTYRVAGRAGDRRIKFSERGAAETFRAQ